MRKLSALLVLLISTVSFGQVTISPFPFSVDQTITITVDENSTATDCNGFNNPSKVYIHCGIGTEANPWSKTIGNWGQDDGVGQLADSGNGTWSITFIPKDYFGLNATEISNATKMGMVFRNENGSQELKDSGCKDFFFDVGLFQMTLISPLKSLIDLPSGGDLNIEASTTLEADFVLKANDISIATASNTTTFNYQHTNLTENTNYVLEATNAGTTISKNFKAVTTVVHQAVPIGLKDGINLNANDPTKATLVLYAPNKEVVHLIGDFNDWEMDNNYLMNKDTAADRFWIELNGLTAQHNHMYQYLIDEDFRVADPYSTTVLSPYNDQYINSSTYPDLPAYPSDKTSHSVTLLRTGEDSYNWQYTGFSKPEKSDLVIYELLIRDFDALHSFDAIKNRLDYIENLGVNAIELMPINEFDGNNSWGYNPSFHMALDKYYGNSKALKQLIDECHRRGIAIILDVVFNHASGQNPYFRMWNSSPGGYNGIATDENPFFNATAKHSYSVDNDINHSTQATNDYIKRVTQFWIEEYRIDGFRWDLTKGFTQNCSPNDEACTGSYQSDRVAVLKKYADYQWEADPDFYIIFEHLGSNTEESQWVNYRLGEGKGIMVWGNHNHSYSEATMGFHDDGKSDFSWISYEERGWSVPANVSYMESHDEERLMYKNLEYGNSSGDYSIKEMNTALERMQLAGMFYFTIPGPKMIWQFGELGYQFSINSDENGVVHYQSGGEVDTGYRTHTKPIRWDYDTDINRKHLYNTWATLTALKAKYPEVFNTTNFSLNVSGSTKTISLNHATMDVIIIGNFDVSDRSVSTNFTETGTWYEYFTDEERNVTSTNESIVLKPGEYRLYSTQRIFDPRGGTASDDSDGDGVMDNEDLCPNTFPGTDVNNTGCPVFTMPSDTFTIEVTSESCPGSNDGKIVISSADNSYNYSASLSGTSEIYQFTVGKTISNLEAGNYTLCISVDGKSYEQCFNISIDPGSTLSLQSKINSSNIDIEMTSGTPPFKVFLNAKRVLTTYVSKFSIPIKHGDQLTVNTDIMCEGIYQEQIQLFDAVKAFPNPTSGIFEIAVPMAENELIVDLYTASYQLISTRSYKVQSGKVALSLENMSSGLYIAKVNTDQPVIIKIVKQ